ncbi:MAG: sigma-70 family RNA polymerase sigma factor [Bacteroidetes bacterium]|nr:sigma-70 family RNA polymerase sigma factor [Bacteroidota bacterium]
MSDRDLVRLYQKGEQQAIAELIHRYKQKIYSSIFFLVRKPELAEDLYQETFIKIIVSLREKRYNEEGKFLPWAVRIAHNLVIDHFRKERHMPMQRDTDEYSVFDFMPQRSRNAVEEIIHDEKINKVRQLIDRLPFEQREVVVMRHYAELSFKEISQILNININTALGRMHYAILKMREMIKEEKISLRE